MGLPNPGGHPLCQWRVECRRGRVGSRVGCAQERPRHHGRRHFPDGPQRYFDTVYNDDYCRTHGLLDKVPSDEPATIDDPLAHAVTTWTRCPVVVDPTQVVPR